MKDVIVMMVIVSMLFACSKEGEIRENNTYPKIYWKCSYETPKATVIFDMWANNYIQGCLIADNFNSFFWGVWNNTTYFLYGEMPGAMSMRIVLINGEQGILEIHPKTRKSVLRHQSVSYRNGICKRILEFESFEEQKDAGRLMFQDDPVPYCVGK